MKDKFVIDKNKIKELVFPSKDGKFVFNMCDGKTEQVPENWKELKQCITDLKKENIFIYEDYIEIKKDFKRVFRVYENGAIVDAQGVIVANNRSVFVLWLFIRIIGV